MNKMIIAGMTVLSLAAQAQQPSSTMSAPASQTQTTTTTLDAAKPAEASKWSGGITFIYEQGARVKSFEEDTEASRFDTQMHLKAKYKYNKNNTLGLNQRVFYSEYVEGYDGELSDTDGL